MTLERMPPLNDEQIAKIKGLKIPVDSSHPGTYWIASIDIESVMPTDEELRMIQSYIEYKIRRVYNQTYQEKIFAKPLPADGGHNTTIFRKGSMWLKQDPLWEKDGEVSHTQTEGARPVHVDPCEGWSFRRMSWDSGWWPRWPAERQSLGEVLDHDESMGDEVFKSWIDWKVAHPDIFPALAVAV